MCASICAVLLAVSEFGILAWPTHVAARIYPFLRDAFMLQHYSGAQTWGDSVVLRSKNFRFRVAGKDKVEGSSMSVIFRSEGSEIAPPLPWAVTECSDVFVRQEGTWKFASHITKDVYRSET